MLKVRARWVVGQQFAVTTAYGHTVTADGGPDYGGDEAGPRPVELVLAALASCTGVAVMTILRRQRQPIAGLEIAVRAERADEWPREFVDISLDYRVLGHGLSAEAVARAIRLSESKYCSVAASLKAPINSSFQIVSESDAARDGVVSDAPGDAPDP